MSRLVQYHGVWCVISLCLVAATIWPCSMNHWIILSHTCQMQDCTKGVCSLYTNREHVARQEWVTELYKNKMRCSLENAWEGKLFHKTHAAFNSKMDMHGLVRVDELWWWSCWSLGSGLKLSNPKSVVVCTPGSNWENDGNLQWSSIWGGPYIRHMTLSIWTGHLWLFHFMLIHLAALFCTFSKAPIN